MVHIKDEGSQFDAPVEIVWKYLQSDREHGQAHRSTRNQQMKPLSETSFILSMERNMGGKWTPESNRITIYPPVAMVIENLEGPLAGSKMINIYTPKAGKTQIDVYGDFNSKMVPANQLEQVVRSGLEAAFNEDAPAIRAMAGKR